MEGGRKGEREGRETKRKWGGGLMTEMKEWMEGRGRSGTGVRKCRGRKGGRKAQGGGRGGGGILEGWNG